MLVLVNDMNFALEGSRQVIELFSYAPDAEKTEVPNDADDSIHRALRQSTRGLP